MVLGKVPGDFTWTLMGSKSRRVGFLWYFFFVLFLSRPPWRVCEGRRSRTGGPAVPAVPAPLRSAHPCPDRGDGCWAGAGRQEALCARRTLQRPEPAAGAAAARARRCGRAVRAASRARRDLSPLGGFRAAPLGIAQCFVAPAVTPVFMCWRWWKSRCGCRVWPGRAISRSAGVTNCVVELV